MDSTETIIEPVEPPTTVHYIEPVEGSIMKQAVARNLEPPRSGATAGELRRLGYQISTTLVDDADVYTVDERSPTGFVWQPPGGFRLLSDDTRKKYLAALGIDDTSPVFSLAT
jgi:hypothetical protein